MAHHGNAYVDACFHINSRRTDKGTKDLLYRLDVENLYHVEKFHMVPPRSNQTLISNKSQFPQAERTNTAAFRIIDHLGDNIL